MTDVLNANLVREVTYEEVRKVVFGLGALKAPRFDGFSSSFFRSTKTFG